MLQCKENFVSRTRQEQDGRRAAGEHDGSMKQGKKCSREKALEDVSAESSASSSVSSFIPAPVFHSDHLLLIA